MRGRMSPSLASPAHAGQRVHSDRRAKDAKLGHAQHVLGSRAWTVLRLPASPRAGSAGVMYSDPSWDIMPVAHPDLPEGKRGRMVRDSLARDPVGVAEPMRQVRHRDNIVAPFSLDR